MYGGFEENKFVDSIQFLKLPGRILTVMKHFVNLLHRWYTLEVNHAISPGYHTAVMAAVSETRLLIFGGFGCSGKSAPQDPIVVDTETKRVQTLTFEGNEQELMSKRNQHFVTQKGVIEAMLQDRQGKIYISKIDCNR